jgi:hypothetical protein
MWYYDVCCILFQFLFYHKSEDKKQNMHKQIKIFIFNYDWKPKLNLYIRYTHF